jgi:hypothetical protein
LLVSAASLNRCKLKYAHVFANHLVTRLALFGARILTQILIDRLRSQAENIVDQRNAAWKGQILDAKR